MAVWRSERLTCSLSCSQLRRLPDAACLRTRPRDRVPVRGDAPQFRAGRSATTATTARSGRGGRPHVRRPPRVSDTAPPPLPPWQVEHVSFRAPVDVGSLLSLRAAVVLVQRDAAPRPLVTVDVEAVIVRPEQATSATSNTFTFTFSLDPEALASSQGGALKRVLPQNGEEAQRQIEVLQLLQDD
eukprot:3012469-Prymnesium_polylepis.1